MTTEPSGEQDAERRPRRHRLRRFFLFLAILLLVLAVVVVAAYRDGTGFDVVRRLFSYGTAERQESAAFSYDAAADNRFAALDDGLAVLSGKELQVFDGGGKQIFSAAVNMTAPALTVGGGAAAAYDVGGTELYVVDKTGQRLHLTAQEDEPYLSATLNGDGWLAVTAEKENYKGCVSVYDPAGELVFTFNSSERFVTDAQVLGDGKGLEAVTLGQKDSVFVSSLVRYDLKKTDPQGSLNIEDGMVLALGTLNDRLAAVSDTALSLVSGDRLAATYAFDGEYLREYSLGGDGFAALLLNRYSSGSLGRLVTVDQEGKELASLDVDGEIRAISAAGKYLAVLYDDHLTVYTSELQEYASLKGTDADKGVVMRADGSALLIAAERASLFLP